VSLSRKLQIENSLVVNTPKKRQKYRECLVEKNFEAALNYLYPIQDILEELEIVCADHLGKWSGN